MEMVCIHLYFSVAAKMLCRRVLLAVQKACRITAHRRVLNHGARPPQI